MKISNKLSLIVLIILIIFNMVVITIIRINFKSDDWLKSTQNLKSYKQYFMSDSIKVETLAPYIKWYQPTLTPVHLETNDTANTSIFKDLGLEIQFQTPKFLRQNVSFLKKAGSEANAIFFTGGNIITESVNILGGTHTRLQPHGAGKNIYNDNELQIDIYISKKKNCSFIETEKYQTEFSQMREYKLNFVQNNTISRFTQYIYRSTFPGATDWRFNCRWEKGLWITQITIHNIQPKDFEAANQLLNQVRDRVMQYYKNLNTVDI